MAGRFSIKDKLLPYAVQSDEVLAIVITRL